MSAKILFEEMPYIENDRLLLREMKPQDAACLAKIAWDPRVYWYLPTFLYEQKYPDPLTVIERARKNAF